MNRYYRQWLPYAVAIGTTAIALMLTVWFEPLLFRVVNAFFYIAIIITSWYGGYRPGMVAIVLSFLAIETFLIKNVHQLRFEQPESLLRLTVFLLVSLTINLVTGSLHESKKKIQQLSQKLAQENAEQLRMALSAAHMGMWDWNLLTNDVKWSAECHQLFGLVVGSFDGRYETFLTYLHPEDRPILEQVVKQALQNRNNFHHEYRIIWPDGSLHWLEVRGQAFYNPAGEPLRMAGTVMAIDQRKQAEQTLGKQLLRIQTLFKTSFDGIVILDAKGNVIDANPRFAQMLGYSSEKLAQMSVFDWDAVFTPQEIQQMLHDTLSVKTGVFETRHRRKDGSIYDVEISSSIVEWEGELLRFCVCRDISDRKLAQTALQQSEHRYRALVNASAQIVWRTDGDGMTISAPEIWEELSGQSAKESLGLGWLDFVHPEDREQTLQSWQESFTNGTLYAAEYRLQMKDGIYRDFAVRGVPICDRHGKVSEWIGTCTDITERKQAEAALKEQQIQLQRQLAEIETIYQSAPIGLSVLDTDLRFIRINQRLAEINGFSVAAHLGHTIRELLPELADTVEPLLRSLLETGQPVLNVEIMGTTPAQPGVQRIWVESFLPLKQGERIIGISTVCEEITERKQAEAQLQQAKQELEIRVKERTAELIEVNQRLLETVIEQQKNQLQLLEQAQLLDLAHDTIITRDLNGEIFFWNEGAEAMYGWKKVEALGKNLHGLLQSQLPQPQAEIEAELLAKGYWEGELTHFSRHGRAIIVASRWVLQKDNAGNPVKILEINNDITERKQAQLAFIESEERRRLALDLTLIGCWDFHLSSGELIWDDNMFTLLGFTPETIEPNYELWRSRIHPEDVDWVEQRFFASIETHTDYAAEYRVIYPDGSVHWLMGRARAIYDESGKALRSLGVLLDISDRKRAEEILHQYERIVSHTTDATALISRNYTYRIVNQAYKDWWHQSDREMIGQTMGEILGEDLFTANVKPRLDKCFAGETIHSDHWCDRAGFPRRFMSITYTPYREADGTISGALIILHNLTQLKQAEEALRESEEKFRQLAEHIQAVFWMTDLQTQQVIYISKAFENIWQKTCQSVYENFGEWIDSIHPDDRQIVDNSLSQQVSTGRSDVKYRIIRPDNSIRWIRDRAFPIKNESGDIVRIAGIAEDITELQKVEQIKSEFIGIVSHELRTPLTAIRAALGLLNSGIYDNRPDKFKRMIEIAALDSDRLVRLVNDILDLERLESGRSVLDKTTCNAADLIYQSVEGVKAIAEQQNITFNINVIDAQVCANADAIMQTLNNLLSNALKFSPSHSTIIISVQQQTDFVLFQISDRGRGIPTDKLEAIFGRFHQVDASDSRDKGGTGLGLAICRSIIDQHNGQIWAESTLGEGSTFFFTIPLARN
ncbi:MULTISPECIES: PAS domain S-box protein [Calothrix]|uniref:histidine kinase n=2 Tax=Calothrix TaxID=1186 RepID=A0ABR8AGT1_9CYAN|nr:MULTISPECIES: PAS domain S-box protein [Calothrix]MBD2199247.1 PAS domain S-box protein [Calothrix parietina FACHB-288]MBD2227949.1 PAS domain S-box protein [Calothrix anomala FACHB-343]